MIIKLHQEVIQPNMQRGITSHSLPKHNFHAPLLKRFPEDIQCILQGPDREAGSIFISNIEAAENPNTLRKLNIKTVLSCAKGYELNHDKTVVRNYLYIPAVDHQSYDISVHIDKGVDFISAHLPHTNILVHCIAGVSRSVTMVIAYFIRQHQMDFQQAYSRVKAKRHIINPNSGFISALQQYHNDIKRQKSLLSRSYLSPRKDQGRTLATASEFPSKQELPASSTAYQQKYYPSSAYASRYQMTPDPKHSQSVSKKPITQLFQQKYIQKNIMEKESSFMRTTTNYNSGYFQSLNAELQEKIQKIRQKYDSQREQLQGKYHQKRAVSDYPADHISQLSKYNQYGPMDYRSKVKTESSDQKNKRYPQPPFQYRNINIDDLFPKKFYNQPPSFKQSSPKKDATLYSMNPSIYLSRQNPLSSSKYRNNDSFRYKRYEMPNSFNMYSTYGLKKKLYP